VRNKLRALLTRFQPDAVVSVYPVYPHMLAERADLRCKSFVVVTDSITVNAIWFRCRANCFLVPNEQTAAMLRAVGIAESAIKVTGFPVTPKFADLGELRQPPSDSSSRRVLYMINAGKNIAPEIVGRLAALPGITLTVTVGRDEKLRAAIEAVREKSATRFEIVGWTDQMPRLLLESHLLIGKAGGATVQETIAACCPMIINQVVPGQEEGNARLMVETGSGVVATTPEAITDTVRNAFANDASQWREWHKNISALSRPSASLEIAQFLLAL
jgi:processive 1,2-diacylglycerol beta-glucosyltransferase